ncbi:MAG: Rrf2 family transcriptional regulator [Deltaproteobacteria bacterium]|nr:Rrf2 family transcriptional regulator [Deltaproteobacteria bacterium]
MKLSKSTELALHGLYQLAVSRPRQLLVSEMAGAQNVSTSYLAKVFQKLARRGLVNSTRGKRGGFTLARGPDEISVADVIRAVEADEPLFDCLADVRKCKARPGCLLRARFKQAEQSMLGTLAETSIGDLLASSNGERDAWLV